ncbi:MAG: hypothetical protein DME59_09060 [Verrucomicrobia bacterium]|nr:MAG: hypothetical protein DME59_09060 [Verrucomicrobiota bacterium]
MELLDISSSKTNRRIRGHFTGGADEDAKAASSLKDISATAEIHTRGRVRSPLFNPFDPRNPRSI